MVGEVATRFLRTALAIAASAVLVACGRPAPLDEALGVVGERPSIVLVTLDTTRADRLGCYGGDVATPNLDALAARGIRFDQVTSVAPLTLPSHASILTGTWPLRHGSHDNGVAVSSAGPTSIAERLAAEGYATGAFVSSFVLDRRFGLARGFDVYDSGSRGGSPGERLVSMASLQRDGGATVAAALAWLDTAKPPYFLWVHLFEPHHPYDAPEPYRSRYPPYDAEVAYADALVGRLLDGLTSRGRGADTVVAVVGDHGESLGEHGESTHGIFVYESTLAVPMILGVAAGSRLGTVVDAPVRTIDLAPTLLEIAGVARAVGAMDGWSLANLIGGGTDEAPRPAYAESHYGELHFGWAPLRSLRVGSRKHISAPRPELYDLTTDPGELDDLANRAPDVLGELEAQLVELVAVVGDGGPAVAPSDAAVIEKLAAIGYLSGGGVERSGADPKDGIAIAEDLIGARRELEAGDVDGGIAALERLVEREPGLADGHFLLGWAALEAGRPESAVSPLGRTLELNSQYPLASYNLGLALQATGEDVGAAAAFEAAIALDRYHIEAYAPLAELLAAAGRHDQALAMFDQALELVPGSAVMHAKKGGLLLRRRELDAAREALLEAVRLDPAVPVAHFNLALLAEGDGDLELAMRHYESAIEAEPRSIKPLVNLALLHRRRGEHAREVELLERTMALDPEFAPGHQLLEEGRRALAVSAK